MDAARLIRSAGLAAGRLPRAALAEPLIFAAWLGLLGLSISRFAATRPLWFDELFTLHLARVASPAELCAHLADGVDLNPPVIYWITRLCVLGFGETTWALRLPALAGMLLGLTCLFAMMRRRCTFITAMLAAILCASSVKVWAYFLEARPYGLAFGFAGLALLCWQRAVEHDSRRWRIALAAAAVLGVSTHYYFVLVLAALATGECVSWVANRRVDVRPMIALAWGGVALAAWYPLWHAAPRDYAAGFWAKVRFNRDDVQQAVANFAEPMLTLPVLAAVLVAVIAGSLGRRRAEEEAAPALPPHELAALVMLALAPVLGVLLGAAATGGFYYRYALPAALGFGAIAAIALERIARGNRAALILAAAGFAWFGLPCTVKPYLRFFQNEERTVQELGAFLHAHAAGRPVIVAHAFEFDRLWHTGAAGSVRVVFVADPERVRQHGHPDTIERGLLKLRGITDVPAVTWSELAAMLAAGEPVMYYGTSQAWIAAELAAHGQRLEPVAARGNATLNTIESIDK